MGMNILVVEDDPVSRLLLATTLRKLGHEVTETADGLAAWTAFERAPFRVVISDWMMPEMDGLELCRRIRDAHNLRYTYILMLTALGGQANYFEAMEAGADDFLNKPLDANELRVRLRVAERVLELQAEVKQLEGLLPICSYCKKIRDEGNTWVRMESFIERQTDAHFSHGICPDCTAKVMANLRRDRPAAR
jgi:sigma-B regulation protein RsbU (phosphoserine phosphatase)